LCGAPRARDHFKEQKALTGHPAGDAHLKEVGAIWRDRLRAADLIARYGGEEFAVLLTATDVLQAQDLIEELRSCVPASETVSAGNPPGGGARARGAPPIPAAPAPHEGEPGGRHRT